jgi:hypothetical protein
MSAGPVAELRDLSVLLQSMALACETEDKELLRALVDATKRRPDSVLASAIGSALEEAFEAANMLQRIPRG